MIRRLPVYFVLDLSWSMNKSGADIILSEALHNTIRDLRKDPMALETLHISIIGFNDDADVLLPLTPLITTNVPNELECRGFSAMGIALSLVALRIKKEVRSNTGEKRGDWKPMIYLLSDGESTDSITNAIVDIERSKAIIHACALGEKASTSELQRVAGDNVKKLVRNESLREYFEWVSQSLKIASTSLSRGIEQDVIGKIA